MGFGEKEPGEGSFFLSGPLSGTKEEIMEAVIFDIDSVFADCEPMRFQAAETLMKRLNIAYPDRYVDQFALVTNQSMWKAIFEEFEVDADMDEILNAQLSLQLKYLKKSELFGIEGFPDLLQELYRNDILVCVTSSFPAIFIKEALKKIKLERFVTSWLSIENVDKNKPEPDVFVKAAEVLGVDASGCIVISDTKNGVIAAKRAGMKCFGFRNVDSGNPNTVDQDLSKAAAVGDSIAALRRLLPMRP